MRGLDAESSDPGSWRCETGVAGSCTTLSWSFSGQSLASTTLSCNGQVITSDIGPTGSLQDCSPGAGQVTYLAKVDSEFGGSATCDAQLTVVGG